MKRTRAALRYAKATLAFAQDNKAAEISGQGHATVRDFVKRKCDIAKRFRQSPSAR